MRGEQTSPTQIMPNLVLKQASYYDDHPQLDLCVSIQRFYQQHSLSTKVLAAALTSPTEAMALAGVHHMTIAPFLLQELSQTKLSDFDTKGLSLFDKTETSTENIPHSLIAFSNDEAAFRLALSRNSNGANECKLIQVHFPSSSGYHPFSKLETRKQANVNPDTTGNQRILRYAAEAGEYDERIHTFNLISQSEIS